MILSLRKVYTQYI